MIDVKITAAKHEEFVVAAGAVEIRAGRRWVRLCDLKTVLDRNVPWAIQANRADQATADGATLAKRLLEESAAERVQIRTVVSDHHRGCLESNQLLVAGG